MLGDTFVGINSEVETPFFMGNIERIDPERWVATVYLEQDQTKIEDVPIMSPYFFKEFGQGAYFMPEAGARCLVGQTMDDYFIFGFLPPLDQNFIDADAEKKPTQNLGAQFTNEARAKLKRAPGQDVVGDRTKSYRSSREGDMLPGDYCLKTRAFNKFKLFNNGNILMEASKLCFRIWTQLKNWMMDICVNYLLKTPGGEIRWTNNDVDNQSDLRKEVKRLVTDEFSSYIELIGWDSNTYRRMVTNRYQREIVGEVFLPEHFFEQIREDGDWVRRVNHDQVDASDVGDDRYREHVAPDGAWTKSIEGDPDATAKYFKNVTAGGVVTEDADGNKTVTVNGSTYIMKTPTGIIHLNPP